MNRGVTDIIAESPPPPEEGRTQTTKSYSPPQLEMIASFVELIYKVAHLGGIHD